LQFLHVFHHVRRILRHESVRRSYHFGVQSGDGEAGEKLPADLATEIVDANENANS